MFCLPADGYDKEKDRRDLPLAQLCSERVVVSSRVQARWVDI